MRLIYLAIFVFTTYLSSAQHTPIVSKVTATWCPNCGDWGWDFMEGMKSEFSAGPVTLLGVHYSGDLQNPAAEWWASNLNSSGQPRFWLDNERISASRSTWTDALPTILEDANETITNAAAAVSYNSVLLDNGALTVSASVDQIPTTTNKLYISTFVYENNVENFQSQQGNNALHPNVLRAAMTDEYQGLQITSFGNYDFSAEMDAAWAAEELGIITVIWEEVGTTYNILSSISQSNVSLLSDTDEILPADLFTFKNGASNLIVTTQDKDNYTLNLSTLAGQQVVSTAFSQEVSIDKSQLSSGLYIATFRSANGLYSQQIFVR